MADWEGGSEHNPALSPNKNSSLYAISVQRHTPCTTKALLSNVGPPLDEDDTHTPPTATKKRAFDALYDVAKLRAQRAALFGLTYDEYVLEILECGSAIQAQLSWPSHLKSLHRSDFAFGTARSLSASDTERIAQIVAKRGVPY